jgi:hypothetical protein
MARPALSCKATSAIRLSGKWAVKLGDFTARDLPTEGGVFHRKEEERAATRSLESTVGGGERAGDTLHL